MVGTLGSVYRTEDFGITWIRLPNIELSGSPITVTFCGVDPADTQKVAVGGITPSGYARIWTSTNRGVTWTLRTINVGPTGSATVLGVQWFGNIIFVSVKIGTMWYLMKSSDNGATWEQKKSSNYVIGKGYLSMYDANDGFWGVFRVTGGGNTITAGTFTDAFVQRGGSKAAVSSLSNNRAGYTPDKGANNYYSDTSTANVVPLAANQFQRTTDGKFYGFYRKEGNLNQIFIRELANIATAVQVTAIAATDQINHIHFFTGNIGVIVTEKGRVYRTTNGGLNWTAIPTVFQVGSNIVALRFVDGSMELDTCEVEVSGISTTPKTASEQGTITFSASGATQYQYATRKAGSTFPLVWVDLPANPYTITGLDAGAHEVYVRDKNVVSCEVFFSATIQDFSIAAEAIGTSTTSNGVCDGTISVSVTGGSGEYEIQFPDSAPVPGPTYTKTGLCAGVYPILVMDLVTGATVNLTVTITQPDIDPEPARDTLFVPTMQAFHFVHEQEANGCDVFQTMDNTLFCKQKFEGFYWQNYFQKYAKCDINALQWNSNYADHLLELRNYHTNEVVKNDFEIVKKQSNTNQERIFQMFLTAHPDDAAKSRVYFQESGLPIPLAVGDSFEIINNADGFNGIYAITGIQTDVLAGQQYLLINRAYDIGAPSSECDGRFLTNSVSFDVFETIINLGAVPNGNYFFVLKATDGPTPQERVSEPINLKETHPDTVLHEWRNFDNAFDITWTTGISFKARFEATFFKRIPGGENVTYRNCDTTQVKLKAKRFRKFLIEYWMLPPYLHEKLCVIWGMDLVKLNGVRHETDQDYQDPNYLVRYPLSNSSIEIEQHGWFKRYNSNDIGPITPESGLIIANNGFIKR